jgi:Ca2+-binding EF-hand superfamily protein
MPAVLTGGSPAENKLTPIVKIKSKQIRKKSASKDEPKMSKVGNAGGHRSSSTIYIPPSKLLKHLDPDEKSKAKEKNAKNSAKKQVLSTQVNRLLKQNTQDLFASLTHEVKRAFETLFDRIDVTDSGGITAKEIQALIKKHTNKNLTLQQVQNVLKDLDVKGTGDIEFDEFIFMLSQPSNYVRLLDKSDLKAISTKETQKFLEMNQKPDENDTTYVFFEALRNATKQDSMTALRTFYKNRLKKLNDHVIHDWSAGQRCIGLSDQEMLKRYETIQGELLRQRVNFCKDNSYKTSPYARPLEWGVMNLREAISARRKLACEIKPPKPELRRADLRAELRKSVPLPRYVTKKRSPLKRTFDYDQLSYIRTKVDNIARNYYNEARSMADENSMVVQKELAVEEIRSPKSRTGFMHTFEAYCTPFVVSPWIPMPSPTLLTSYSPLGRSKFGALRARNTVIHGRRGYTTGDCSKYKYMGVK